nr:transposase [Metallosphaera yellowstonensis]
MWEIEELQRTSRPWDCSSWRRERLQGHLTIFTINNVVRELVGELNLRSVEAFLRSSSAI